MARINEEWKVAEEGALAAEVKNHLAFSVRQAKGLIDSGCVKVNGEEATKHGHRVMPGDSLHVNYDPAQKYDLAPSKSQLKADPYEVLFEDKHLLFVNKPAGLLTVPSETGNEPSLADAVTEHYQRRGFKRFQLFIAHRIDRFTSGVIVFAKTPEALMGLKKHFELHRLQRVYKAILVGDLPENSGTLKGHLIEQVKTMKMRVVDPKKKQHEGAKAAITHYRVIERLPGHTVVEVRLETGRRNQIRVQFADRGFPLLGDQVYGEISELLDRQALHAELLGFKHPVTEEQVTVTAALPADMANVLKKLRTQARLERAVEGKKGDEGVFKPTQSKFEKNKRVQRSLRYSEGDREESPRGPRRSFNDREDRGGNSERPRTSRPPRRDDEAPRPRRTFADREDRGERSERPRTSRPPRRDDEAPRPRRTFADREDRGERSERPRTSRPPRRDDEAPRPRGPRREEGSSRPRQASGDRPKGPRTEGRRESGSRPAKPGFKSAPRKPRKG
jgi:23S rRNA pseudouridine1911/1915/1917 synthase